MFACFTQKARGWEMLTIFFTPASRQVMFETFGESQLILVFACLLACVFICLFVCFVWLFVCLFGCLLVSLFVCLMVGWLFLSERLWLFQKRSSSKIPSFFRKTWIQHLTRGFHGVWLTRFRLDWYLWDILLSSRHFTRLYLGKLILNFDIFMFNTRHPYLLSCSLWFLFRCVWWVQSYRTPVFGCLGLGPKM